MSRSPSFISKFKLLIINRFLPIAKLIMLIDSIDPSFIFIFFFISIEGKDFTISAITAFSIASFRFLLGVASIVIITFKAANFNPL